MEEPENLPGFQDPGEDPPLLTEAADLWKSLNESDKSKAAQILFLAQGLAKLGLTKNHIVALVSKVVPSSKETQKKKESPAKNDLPPSQDTIPEINILDELEALFPKLEHGKNYRISDFIAMLPEKSPLLEIESKRGKETAVGGLLCKLAKQGKLKKLKDARLATYRLPDAP